MDTNSFSSNELGVLAVHKCSAPQAAGCRPAGNDERYSVAPALGVMQWGTVFFHRS